MNFLNLQDETIFGRFKASQRDPYVKGWLNNKYARVWTSQEWAFRIVEPTAVDTVASNRYLGPAAAANKLPTDFSAVRAVYDDNLDQLEELEAAEFDRRYLYGRVKGQVGRPEAFTVVNRQIILGPVPDKTYTFYLGYKRLMGHLDNGGAFVVGVMVNDTDKPVWPEEHHELLVVGAQVLGLKLVEDPAWQALESEFNDLYAAMLGDDLLHDSLARPRRYERDPL